MKKCIFLFSSFLQFWCCSGQVSTNQEELYKNAIHKADSSYLFKSFDSHYDKLDLPKYLTSQNLYREATIINPSKTYPQDRLVEIHRDIEAIGNLAVISKRYSDFRLFHRKADSLAGRKEFLSALKYFKMADSVSASDFAKDRFKYSYETESIIPLDSAVKFISLVQAADKLLEIYFETNVRDEEHEYYTKNANPVYTLYPAQDMYKRAGTIKMDSKLIQLRLKSAVRYRVIEDDRDPG